MAGSSGGKTSGGMKKARIEIIPLIDVIFFLLATFVLFTLSLNKSNGVSGINLPPSETGIARDPAGTVTISVTDAGTIAWNKDFISLQEFIERLKTYKVSDPEGRILINGDEAALFNAALYVFDEARKSGFQKIFIETKVRAAGR
ncbi:MAG: biopolymer transporter ExbD [Verrucomicrobia bacterium]|nr:biopolymer transporter ExbD [Verrucomicrobiota bacterium]